MIMQVNFKIKMIVLINKIKICRYKIQVQIKILIIIIELK